MFVDRHFFRQRLKTIGTVLFVLFFFSKAEAQIDLLNLDVVSPEQRILSNSEDEQNTPENISNIGKNLLPESEDFQGELVIRKTSILADIKPVGAPYTDGITFPDTIWKGMRAEEFTQYVRGITPVENLYLRDAFRDALLSFASLPEDLDGNKSLSLRLEGLLRLGLVDDARRLYQAAQKRDDNIVDDVFLAPIVAKIALLSLDVKTLCALANDTSRDAIKRQIICLLIEGDKKQAALELQLLGEQSSEVVDDGFATLAWLVLFNRSSAGEDEVFVPTLENMFLAHIGGLRIFNDGLEEDLVFEDALLAGQYLLAMKQKGLSEAARFTMLKAGFAKGVIEEEILQEQYASLIFSVEEFDNVASQIQNVFDQRVLSLSVQQTARLLQQFDMIGAKNLVSLILTKAEQADAFLEVLLILKPYLSKLPKANLEEVSLRLAYWVLEKKSARYDSEVGSLSELLNQLNGYPLNGVDTTKKMDENQAFLAQLSQEDGFEEDEFVEEKPLPSEANSFAWIQTFVPLFQDQTVFPDDSTDGIMTILRKIDDRLKLNNHEENHEDMRAHLFSLGRHNLALSQRVARWYLAEALVATKENR